MTSIPTTDAPFGDYQLAIYARGLVGIARPTAMTFTECVA